MKMDEATIKHYGKSTAARVDKAFLIEHDAAVLLPESLTSHRVIVFANSRAYFRNYQNACS
jgi:hypothetical protein